jgi:uncharacterized protein YdaU (DUF1376 family)
MGKNNGQDGPALTGTPSPDQPFEEASPLAKSKSTKAPAFQFYARDFLADQEQALMSLQEAGAYIRLMSHCWLKGTLPSSTVDLARLCGATTGQMTKMRPALARCFTETTDGRWTHPRLDKERKKQADHSRRQSDRADKRWEKTRNATALPRHSDNDALHLQSSSASASIPSEERRSPATAPRGAPIAGKRKLWAAFEGARGLAVPTGVHQKFRDLLNRSSAESELFAWYAEVCEDWACGAHKDDQPGTDLPAFWDARFNEKWPPSKSSAPDSKLPAWAQRGLANLKAGQS